MKPNNDSEKPWEVISSEYLHKNLWLTVRKDHVVLPNGNHIPSYYILEYPNWVNTIAITRDGQFVFIRQYRHGLQKTSYELCAGVCEGRRVTVGFRSTGALGRNRLRKWYMAGIHANFSQPRHSH